MTIDVFSRSGGVDSASYSLNVTTAVANSVAYGAVAMRNRSHTPGSGYIERAEFITGSSGSEAGVAVNGSFSGTVDWAVVAIEIRPGGGTVNHPPVAQDQSVTTSEDTAKAITLTATDADGDPLTYTIVSGPSYGTLAGSGTNRTYTPAAY